MSSTIITIGRQYGSGGHKIGEFLANRLQVPYYDDELMIIEAGIDTIIDHELSQTASLDAEDEKDTRAVRAEKFGQDRFAVMNPLYYGETVTISYDLYKNIIRQLAGNGDAVMIGRCADEILRGEGCKVLSVFIAAPIQHRVARTVRCEGVPAEEIVLAIAKKDAARKAFYESHTGRVWGKPESYDLYYDTSKMDIGSIIVDIIRHYKALKDKNV